MLSGFRIVNFETADNILPAMHTIVDSQIQLPLIDVVVQKCPHVLRYFDRDGLKVLIHFLQVIGEHYEGIKGPDLRRGVRRRVCIGPKQLVIQQQRKDHP